MNILEARRRTLGADVYKKTVQGNPVSVRSLARMRPGLKVFGKSEQFTTTGAQLFDVSAGGAGWIDTETGEFLSSQDNYVSDFIKVGPENQYYINNDVPLRYIYSYNIDKGFLRKESYSFAFTTGRDVEYIRFAISGNAAGALKTANTVMLNAGSSALPWEPYTGGKPSPSPDYPQEIHSAGEDGSIQVYVTGANLADVDNAFVDESPEKIENGFILDAIDMPHRLIRVPCKTKKGNKYTFKFDYEKLQGNENALLSIVLQGGDGAPQYIPIGGTVVCNSDRENFSIYTDSNNIGARFKVTNVICNQGDTIYPYEPYKQPQSLTVQTPNGLPGIPVTSGGNYTDAEGQQWICDEIDFKRGKYVQRVRKYIFDGSSDENWFVQTYENIKVAVIKIKEGTLQYSTPLLCNIAKQRTWSNIGTCFINEWKQFSFNNPDVNDIINNGPESWKTYLQTNNIELLYCLKTPVETDLTTEQLTAYANLHTNRPTTVVSATDDAGIKLTYKTKKSLEVT